MSVEMPMVPAGKGIHPIPLVVLSANNLASSTSFNSKLFDWQAHPMSAELTAVVAPAGPTVSLRSKIPDGFPGMVPSIGVPDMEAALARVVAAGGTVERATWSMPMVGRLARFKDLSGTVCRLTEAVPPNGMPRMPILLGSNPKPPGGAICNLEMSAADGVETARCFGELFGRGTLATMPQYMAFDPGTGVAGIFQSHTPAIPAVAYILTAVQQQHEADGASRRSCCVALD